VTATLRERAFYRAFGVDDVLRSIVSDGARVLDVGSSDGSGSALLQELPADAVDIHAPSLCRARDRGLRGRCVQADILDLPFADGSYDVVTAFDVIEHLPKERGFRLLDELERICRGAVVVVTPFGFVEQPAEPDQPWMEHLSGWWPDEFRTRGYAVRGTGGVRFARRAYAEFRWGPLGKAVGLATVPMARHFPAVAYDIVAIKRKG
jgi:SAM-dependent methyltransferase